MIYVLLADGFEEIEALAFADILRRAELNVKLVSINDEKNVTGSHGIAVVADTCIDDIDKNSIEAVVLPGGLPGTYNLRDSKKVKELLDYAFENNKILGAICAAPYVFDLFGYLKGTRATVNPGFEEKMNNCIFEDKRVVHDKNIITSKGPGSAHEFAKEFVAHFKGKDVAEGLINEMLYI